MNSETVKLSIIKPNPDNPRVIKDVKFAALVENVKKYPKFLEKRPLVIKSWADPTILGGNMRYQALKSLGYKEIPALWVKTAEDFTDDELKAFIILDNIPFGDWDFDSLANNFDFDELQALGLDIPDFSALQQINMDDFFARDENIAGALQEKFTITLEYSMEEGTRVKAALAKINPSAEAAVRSLLDL